MVTIDLLFPSLSCDILLIWCEKVLCSVSYHGLTKQINITLTWTTFHRPND